MVITATPRDYSFTATDLNISAQLSTRCTHSGPQSGYKQASLGKIYQALTPLLGLLSYTLSLGLCLFSMLAVSQACYAAPSSTMVLSWHQAMQRAIHAHPDIKKALIDYQKHTLSQKKSAMTWQPTLSQASVNHRLPLLSNSDFRGIDTQSKLSWTSATTATQLSVTGNIGINQDKRLTSSTKVTLSQPVTGKAIAQNRLDYHMMQQKDLDAARSFKAAFFDTLLKTSKLYNSIVKYRIEMHNLQTNLRTAQEELNNLRTMVQAGKKPKKDINYQEIKKLQLQIDIKNKSHRINQKMIALKTALAYPIDQRLDIPIGRNEDAFVLPQRLKKPPAPLDITSVMSSHPELINLKNKLVNQKKQVAIEKLGLYPSSSLDITWQSPKEQTPRYVGLGLSLPLDNRGQRINIRKEQLSLQTLSIQFNQECQVLQNTLIDRHQDLREQASIIRLEAQKLQLEKDALDHSRESFKAGSMSSFEYFQKSKSFTSAKLKLIDSIRGFFNQLDDHDVLNNQFLKVNQLTVPVAIEGLLQEASRERIALPQPTAYGGIDCQTLQDDLLKKSS